LEEAKGYGLKKKVDVKSKKIDLKIISDYRAENIDVLVNVNIVGDKAIKINEGDLQKIFDFWVREHLRPQFYPEDRSIARVKESIYKFFYSNCGFKWGESEDEAIQIVLSEKNNPYFIAVLERAKEKYKEETEKRESELVPVDNWNIPESLTYGENAIKEDKNKSIMEPFYKIGEWKSEAAFIDFLEKAETVEWWFKNGDRDATFFAVPYENGERKPFYVDFIVKLKDERIGLFDPHGTQLSDFGPKSDGLQKYIKEENKKGKKIFGGIVANTDLRDYKGRWIYFDKSNKELRNDFSNWKDLIL